MADAFGDGFVAPNGTGPCCRYAFDPSEARTGTEKGPAGTGPSTDADRGQRPEGRPAGRDYTAARASSRAFSRCLRKAMTRTTAATSSDSSTVWRPSCSVSVSM